MSGEEIMVAIPVGVARELCYDGDEAGGFEVVDDVEHGEAGRWRQTMLRVLRRQADGALFGVVWEAGLTEQCDSTHPWETVGPDGTIRLRRLRKTARVVESYEFGAPEQRAAGDWYVRIGPEPVRMVQVDGVPIQSLDQLHEFLAPLGTDDVRFFDTSMGPAARVEFSGHDGLFTMIVAHGGRVSVIGPREFVPGRVPVVGDWIVRFSDGSVIISDRVAYESQYRKM